MLPGFCCRADHTGKKMYTHALLTSVEWRKKTGHSGAHMVLHIICNGQNTHMRSPVCRAPPAPLFPCCYSKRCCNVHFYTPPSIMGKSMSSTEHRQKKNGKWVAVGAARKIVWPPLAEWGVDENGQNYVLLFFSPAFSPLLLLTMYYYTNWPFYKYHAPKLGSRHTRKPSECHFI